MQTTYRMKWRSIFTIILVFVLNALVGCKASSDRDWSILFQVIPTQLTTSESNINIVYYLLKQTHFPIFEEGESGQYSSRILTEWSRNATNTLFKFCPNANLEFHEKKRLTTNDILDSIHRLENELDDRFDVSIEDACVRVATKKPYPNLIKLLSDYRYAPTTKCAEKWECGLGQYAVIGIYPDKLVLKHKKTSALGYQTITLGQQSAFSKTNGIEDTNRSIEEIPKSIDLSNYASFEVNLLQTIIVILNHPSPSVRKQLYSCMKSLDLSNAFNPSLPESNKVEIATILPSEFHSEATDKTDLKCEKLNGKIKILNFVNWRNNNSESLGKYLEKIFEVSNIRINKMDIDPSSFVSSLNSRDERFKRFDLIPMAIDAERNDFTSFFRPIAAPKKKYLSFEVKELEAMYSQLLTSTDSTASLNIAKKMANKIKESHIAIPLYQVKRIFRYPKNIKKIETGRSFLEYPEVDKLEID